MITRRKATAARRGVAGLIAASFLAAALPVATNTVSAVENVDLDLTTAAGANRYDTAAKIATATFGESAPLANIIIARGDAFPDALAGNALAGAAGAPILLTRPNALPIETREAIEELADENTVFHILGGPDAINQSVVTEIESLFAPDEDDEDADVDADEVVFWRIGGDTRYDTAINIAEFMAENLTIGTTFEGERSAFITTGQNFADAVAVGPLAYHGRSPVLLVPNLGVDSTQAEAELDARVDAVLNALVDLDIDSVIILGETAAVPASIEAAIAQRLGPDKILRIGGENRFETAALIADYARDQLAFNIQTVLIARGENDPQAFADALAGGPHGGEIKAPIILATPNSLPAASEQWLDDNDNVIRLLRRLGGPAAVSDAVMLAARNAAQTGAIYQLGDRTNAPELQFVRAVAGAENSNVLEFVFDEVVDGSTLRRTGGAGEEVFLDFRGYSVSCGATAGTAGTTTQIAAIEASILGNGNVARVRFAAPVSEIQRVGVQWDAVLDQGGLANIEAGYPVNPRACDGTPGTAATAQSNLIYTTNWQTAPELQTNQSISVDFVFNNPIEGASDWPAWLLGPQPGTFFNTDDPLVWDGSGPLANQFWLVGNQSTTIQGTSISVQGTGQVADGYQVRVFFDVENQANILAGALRRGYVVANSQAPSSTVVDGVPFIQQVTTGPVWQYQYNGTNLCRISDGATPLFILVDDNTGVPVDNTGAALTNSATQDAVVATSATAALPAGLSAADYSFVPLVAPDDDGSFVENCLTSNVLSAWQTLYGDFSPIPVSQLRAAPFTTVAGSVPVSFPETWEVTNGAIPFWIINPAGLTADGLTQAGGYVQSSMITVDPDLVSVVQQPNIGTSVVFDFTFDEAVSRNLGNITAANFGVYNREFTSIQRPTQVNWVAGMDSRTLRAYFPAANFANFEVAGAFVDENAVRATDTQTTGNNGFNRADGVLITFDIGGTPGTDGFTLEAGYTTLPDLSTVTRSQNAVTQNYSITFTFDARYGGNICTLVPSEDIVFSLYDPQGIRTATSSITTCTGNSVTFVGGLNGFDNDAIENAAVGGVSGSDVEGDNGPSFELSLVTEGSAIVNGAARFPAGAELVPAGMS